MFSWLTAALETRRATAMHEAGHGVIAYRLDFDLGAISIRGDKHRLGSSVSEEPWADGSRDEAHVLGLYAGLAAQRLVHPTASPDDGAADDYDEAARFLPLLTSDQATLEARAAELVAEHRAEIEAVAGALFEEETLAADDADVIMHAVVEGEDWRSALAQYRLFRRAAARL